MFKSYTKLVILLVLVVLLTGCQGLFGRPIQEAAPTPTPIPTPIVPEKPTYVVQRGKVIKELEFVGRISPVEEVSLYFKTSGYVKRVLIDEGDQVQTGDLLAELEIDDLLKQMAQAEVTLNSAQLRLDEAEKALERQIAQAETTLKSAKLRLDEADKALEQQIAQAELSLATAQARLSQAEDAQADAITQAEWKLRIAGLNLEQAKKANQQQVAEAQRALEVARIRLAQLQEEPDPTDTELVRLDLERARNSLWQAQIQRDSIPSGYQKDQAEAAVAIAEIAAREAEIRYRQVLSPTVGENDLRLQQIEVERARTALEQAQDGLDPLLTIEVQRAQQELDRLKEQGVDPLLTIEVQRAQQELNRLREEGEDPLLVLEVQRAQQELNWLKEGVDPILVNEVNQAQLALERLQAQVADAQIVAPVDGEVLSLTLYPGRPAEAFKAVIVVADPSAIEVSADLSSSQLKEMAEGQEAAVTLRAYPGQTWQGTVRRLPYPYGSGGGTESLAEADTSARVGLEGDLSDLQLGDLARVNILLEEKDDILWLPPAAIRTFQGRKFVVVQDADRQRRVDVQIGIESVERVEILEGLEEGQIVVGQ